MEYTLRLAPESAKSHLLLGRIAKVTNQSMDTAIPHFEKAQQYDPGHIQAKYELGTAHLHNGEPSKACTV